MARGFISFLLALSTAACSSELMQGTIAPALISFSDPQAGLAAQQAFQRRQAQVEAQRQEEATKREVQAAFTLFQKVWEETGDPFEARRQTRTKHSQLFMKNPVWSRNIDQWTALA